MTQELTLETALSTERSNLVMHVDKIEIVSVETRDHGMRFMRACLDLKDRIGAWFDPHVQRAYEAHRALIKARADELKPVEISVANIKAKIFQFERDQKLKIASEQMNAENERLRLEKEKEKEARKLERKGLDVQAELVRRQELEREQEQEQELEHELELGRKWRERELEQEHGGF